MKVDRLISIIMILMDKERISAQKLADMFEVSQRTIYRDIDAIDLAGIPVRSISGVGGGFEIMPNYKIDKNVFSASDLSAILMGLSGFSNIIKSDELFNAFNKVKSFIPPDQLKEVEFNINQIHIDLSHWMANSNIKPYLEIIKQAMQERKLVSFEYLDRYGNKTKRSGEPYQLVLKSNNWYWQGYCLKRKEFRLFKLLRMSDLQILEETFIPRDYQKPILDFKEHLEILQTKIKIRIHKSLRDRLLDYCTYEDIFPDGKEYYLINLPFIENDYYYNILLGFGDKCECIEPLHIRNEVKHRIKLLSDIYKD